MRANNALGIDVEVRNPEDRPNGMKPKIGALTSTSGSGSDPSSQPTTSGHDLFGPIGEPAPRPVVPSKKASIIKAKPPAARPVKPVKLVKPVKVAKTPAAPAAKPRKTGRPLPKGPAKGRRGA